jgi:hypothetical protein
VRFGFRYVATLGAGLGYRFERITARRLFADNNALIDNLPAISNHILIATVRGSFELRPWDLLSAGVWSKATIQVVGGSPELDLAGGLSASVSFYP